LLHYRLCGLVASRSHVQGSSVQGILPIHCRPDSSSGCAPLPLLPIRSPACRLPRMNRSTSRPCSMDRSVPGGR
jgi:hypothetical protein